jgi:hypothetical protein
MPSRASTVSPPSPTVPSGNASFGVSASFISSSGVSSSALSASSAASWFNPFSYSIFGGGSKADPQQQVQDKLKAVANENKARTNLNGSEYWEIFAKLMYYKTVEVSLHSGAISSDALPAALSEENVKQGIEQIKNDPALHALDTLQHERGFAKKTRAFLAQVSEDPSVFNAVHKDYMQKKANLINAQSAPQAKKPPQHPAPEKAPAPPSQKGLGG